MQLLKQSTAATVVVGPVLDADGAAVTTATVTNFSIAKNGTVAALTTETVTHSANGYYTIALTTTNTNTVGRLDVIVNASTMSMSNHRYDILVAATYDAIVTNGIATSAQATAIEANTLDIQSRLPATLDSGNMRSSVQSMAADTLTASALAADAVTEIQSGLATSTGVTAAFTEIKGAGWSSATDTLEEIADASGGGGTVTIAPLSSLAPERVNGTTISVAVGDVSPVSIDVYDANGVAIDLTAQGNLEVCIESRDNLDLQVVAHASITISGTGNRKATWTPNAAAVGIVDKQRWSLRTASGKRVLAYGPWVVERVALNDA
jgi:hypothetical protein